MPSLSQEVYTTKQAREDLSVLDKISAQHSGGRDTHVAIQQAVMRLEAFIDNYSNKKSNKEAGK